MAVVTLRPNGTVSHGGTIGTNGGGDTSSAHAATSDNVTNSYIRWASANLTTVLDLGTYTIPANSVVKGVRVRAYGDRDGGTVTLAASLRVGGIDKAAGDFLFPTASEETKAYVTSSPSGGAWTQADIDALQLKFTTPASFPNGVNVREAYVDLDVVGVPTVTAPADNAAVKLTTGVPFAWTHNDAESDPQAGWAIKRRAATLGTGLVLGAEEWWAEAAGDVLSGPTTISTDTGGGTATAYSNQRKIDRCQNGVLWAFKNAHSVSSGEPYKFFYSTDDGATWVEDVGARITVINAGYTNNGSFFIDLDDYCHWVYKSSADGFIHYRRGTPNAGRTAWTWSATTQVSGDSNDGTPDFVVHREGTGWKVHVVLTSFGSNAIYYARIGITSGGVVAVEQARTQASAFYGNGSINMSPAIDFNHTGDGKTVAGGTPHLYMAFSTGGLGASKGTRYRKATYTAPGGTPTWTWGSEVLLTERYLLSGEFGRQWLNCLFDGTRVIVVGQIMRSVTAGASTQTSVVVFDVDATTDAVTERVLLDDLALTHAERLDFGSATYDAQGNVYIFGRNGDEAAGSKDLVYRKWTRATTTLGAEVVIDAGVGDLHVSAKRGYSNARIEILYADGTASPYNVTYDSILLVQANAWNSGQVVNAGTAASKTISTWPSDAATYQYAIATSDAGGLGVYSAWRTLNPYEWWNGTAWVPMVETFVTTATTEALTSAGLFTAGSYKWTAATKDSYSLQGVYAAEFDLLVTSFERWGAVFI